MPLLRPIHPSIHFQLVNEGNKDLTTAVPQRVRDGREHQVDGLEQPVNGGNGEAVRAAMVTALQREGCSMPVLRYRHGHAARPDRRAGRAAAMDVFGARVKLLGRNVERRAMRHLLAGVSRENFEKAT